MAIKAVTEDEPEVNVNKSTKSRHRRRAKKSRQSPPPYASTPSPESISPVIDPATFADLKYTRHWGITILFLSWFVFVVGIGAICGIWQWAFKEIGWPTLKHASNDPLVLVPLDSDDKDVVINGYYACLMILMFGVVIWSWAILNWLGLKYFRHSSSSTY